MTRAVDVCSSGADAVQRTVVGPCEWVSITNVARRSLNEDTRELRGESSFAAIAFSSAMVMILAVMLFTESRF